MTTLNAQFIQQTEQENGFWVTQFQLTQNQPLPINLTLNHLGVTLQLFSQENAQIQFLSSKKCPEKTLKSPKNNQAWLFLDDFKKTIKPNHTVCLLADEFQLGQAFLLLKALKTAFPLATILATETAFPFQVKPARYLFNSLPYQAANMIGACPLLEDWGIANRLCHSAGQPGCFEGTLKDFLTIWEPPKNWQLIRLT